MIDIRTAKELIAEGVLIDVTSLAMESGVKAGKHKFRMSANLYRRLYPDIPNRTNEDILEFRNNMENLFFAFMAKGKNVPVEQRVMNVTVKYSIFEVEQEVTAWACMDDSFGPAVHFCLSEDL